jgi:hypothetical protein
MNRESFKKVFEEAIEKAILAQEEIQNRQLPRNFEVQFYGMDVSGEIIDVDLATDLLYIGEDEFVYLVDIAALGANSKVTRFFVRVSGYPPKATFEETYNDPPGSGPFKQVIEMQFRQLQE